jgi:hypothetical protein
MTIKIGVIGAGFIGPAHIERRGGSATWRLWRSLPLRRNMPNAKRRSCMSRAPMAIGAACRRFRRAGGA